MKELRHAWYEANKEKAKRQADEYNRLEPVKKRKYQRQLEYQKEVYKTNPEKRKAISHRRRARVTGAGGSFTAQQWVDLRNLYGNQCLCCHRTEAELTVVGLLLVPDHVLPIAKGGTNNISNIQPLCHGKEGCNNSKGTKCLDYRTDYMQRITCLS